MVSLTRTRGVGVPQPQLGCDSFNMMWENNKVAQMNMINGEHDDVGNDEVDQINMIKGEYNDVGK